MPSQDKANERKETKGHHVYSVLIYSLRQICEYCNCFMYCIICEYYNCFIYCITCEYSPLFGFTFAEIINHKTLFIFIIINMKWNILLLLLLLIGSGAAFWPNEKQGTSTLCFIFRWSSSFLLFVSTTNHFVQCKILCNIQSYFRR